MIPLADAAPFVGASSKGADVIVVSLLDELAVV